MPDQSDAPQSVAASAEQLPPAIRELHRAVLRGFRDSGQVHRDDLRPTAAALGVDLDDALHQLGRADLVHSAPDGQIEVAYPFSRQPTGHTVCLIGHPPVAAMCAIDALGIPVMTGTDGVIDSADPDTGTPIGFPLKSWRLHLSCVRLDGSDSLVLVGGEQRRRAVPSFDVVEVLAPGDNDSAGLGAGAEMVPRQHLMFEGGEERLRGGVIEARPDPAHRLNNPEPTTQFREILCRVG